MKININIPTCWNELSERQLQKLVVLVYSGKSGMIFDLKCLQILVNLKWWQFFKTIKLAYALTQVPISEFKKSFDYIFNENNRTIFPQKINGFFAPMDRITNLTIEEFSVADNLHIKWRETKNQNFLIYLVATLYSKTRQPREVFDKNNLDIKIKYFDKVPLPVLLSVEMAYFGCKNNLVKRFPKVFPATTQKTKQSNKYGFGKVVLQMAGGKFGNHEQTKNTNIYTFLEQFSEDLKNAGNEKNA